VEEDSGNPVIITIPPGELFQGLKAQEYRYSAYSVAENAKGNPEAILELRFKSRLVPLFQFAAFYNKDLEILPGPAMTLAGPVHTNGDLYLDSGASLDILGQVTTAGDLYRGRKNSNTCNGNPVRVIDPLTPQNLPSCSGRTLIPQSAVTAWNGMIYTGVDPVTVPDTGSFEAQPGRLYWDNADLRVVLDLNAGGAIQVRNQDNTGDAVATAALTACGVGAVNTSNTFFNNREGMTITLLEINMQGVLNCIDNNPGVLGPDLDDTTQGGLVFHFTVSGPNSAGLNNYGVLLTNGNQLQSTNPGAPLVQGLTVVTDQAVYVHGNYNAVNKIPAAVMADSLNVLSGAYRNTWNDAAATWANRNAADTTINAAFLAGTDTTGGPAGEGTAGQDIGIYNGGLENYPRFHENWSGRTLTYRGSFVSLNRPLHVDGVWVYGNPQYTAPNRNWSYDTAFNDAANLPPLTPQFVYLRQELFVRQFER
jgi:hypothetical protein